MYKPNYIPFEQALSIVLDSVTKTEKTEIVSLEESVGRVLASDVLCNRDIPPFNRVAMDGYACKRSDLNNHLKVLETVAAGQVPKKIISDGECSKVMTGCMLPDGADMVVMVELSKIDDNNMVFFDQDLKNLKSNNVALKGEDMKKGALFVEKGTLIEPKTMGILSSVGAVSVNVYKKPVIGIIITGDEVLEPNETPKQHQILNSNGIQLISQIKRAGGIPKYYGICKDSREIISETFKKADSECDVILMSGGVSMGEFDFVPDILKENGYEILFNKVASKPGRPSTFAVSETGWCFGMPGNPVTSFVVFEILTRPFINKFIGKEQKNSNLRMVLAADLKVKKSERITWWPGKLSQNGEIQPVEYHGSGHFHSLKEAFGLVRIAPETGLLEKGSLVDVRPI